MKGSLLKIIVLLLAIAGVIAIGWYLLVGDGAMMEKMTDSESVKVSKVEAPKDEAAPAAAPEPAKAPSTPAPAAAPQVDLVNMTPEQFGVHWNSIDEAERAAFVTDFVQAAGENNSVAVARKFSSGPVENRNYELSYSVAQVLVAEYKSRLGSYIAGTMVLQGRGAEKDLDAAMRYLRHPGLLETTGALYFRATILLDENYVKPSKKAAIGLLKKTVSVGSADEWAVVESKKLLAKLGDK
jgi:hypothetical protein